jgi:hypothetical protein
VGEGVGGDGSGSGGFWGGSRVWVSAGMTTVQKWDVEGKSGAGLGVSWLTPKTRACTRGRSDRIVRSGRGARSEDGKNPRGLKRLGQGLGLDLVVEDASAQTKTQTHLC